MADLITKIVGNRGLDPANFGVNIAAGKILPVNTNGNKAKTP